MRAKITSLHATASGVVANGRLTGKLRSGAGVSRDSAPVKFRVAAPAQIQNLLNQLGIGDLSGGLTQLDLNRILAALGLGQTTPTG